MALEGEGADNSPIRPNRRFAPFVWLIDQLRLRPYTSTASVPDLAAAQFRGVYPVSPARPTSRNDALFRVITAGRGARVAGRTKEKRSIALGVALALALTQTCIRARCGTPSRNWPSVACRRVCVFTTRSFEHPAGRGAQTPTDCCINARTAQCPFHALLK